MDLLLVENYEALSDYGADWLVEAIEAKPNSSIVVATGNTPMGVYHELAERYSQGLIDPSRLRAFQLDAYVGLAAEDQRSLFGWTRRSFIEPLGIPETNVVRLEDDILDREDACRQYEEAVREAGGFDISILGLGSNGHLGFNKPPSPPGAPTRLVNLTPEIVESNAHYWGGKERVPSQALTCGMDLLLAARRTLLLVSGTHKHHILHRTIEGPPTPEVLASYLQLASHVTVLADRAAWEGEQTK